MPSEILHKDDEIEIGVSGLLNTVHRLETRAGALIGEMTVSLTGHNAVFQGLEGPALRLNRTSPMGREYEIRESGSVLGSARPRGFFSSAKDVEFGGRAYDLAHVGFLSKGWQLREQGGVLIADIGGRGLRRGAHLIVAADVELALIVFAYYIVYLHWDSEASASSACSL